MQELEGIKNFFSTQLEETVNIFPEMEYYSSVERINEVINIMRKVREICDRGIFSNYTHN